MRTATWIDDSVIARSRSELAVLGCLFLVLLLHPCESNSATLPAACPLRVARGALT